VATQLKAATGLGSIEANRFLGKNEASGHSKWAYFDAKDNWNATPTKVAISGSGLYIAASNGNFGNTGWDGQTFYTCSSGVFQAPVTMDLNDYYTVNEISQLDGVAGHEFGHALGLGHSSCGVLMYGTTGGCRPQTPQQDDINGINHIYGAP
jgi:predicted Zn-dependent protease